MDRFEPIFEALTAGGVRFESVWRDSEEVSLERVSIRVASLEHLIRMKLHVGRPQDLIDVEWLKTIAEMRKDQREDRPE
jgi:hypothetical protein